MICKKCGNVLEENAKFCAACGETVDVVAAKPAQPVSAVPTVTPVYSRPKQVTEEDLPEQYRPLGAWSYFWLQVLYSVPIVGFIFLIIFSFKSDNINRRNFTRSYWCKLVLVAIVLGIALIIMAALGGGIFAARYSSY